MKGAIYMDINHIISGEENDKLELNLENISTCQEGFTKKVLETGCYSIEPKRLAGELHWEQSEKLISYMWDLEVSWSFHDLERHFNKEWRDKAEVTANSVSFWHHIFTSGESYTDWGKPEFLRTVIYGTIGYGDFFRFNAIQVLPETLVLSDDVMPKMEAPIPTGLIEEQERHLMKMSELKLKSINQSEEYFVALSVHKKNLKKTYTYLDELSKLEKIAIHQKGTTQMN